MKNTMPHDNQPVEDRPTGPVPVEIGRGRSVAGADPDGAAAGDEQAVRDLFRQLLDAWGRGDGDAYGARFTGDADYVAFDGSNRRGTGAIAGEHQQLFD